MKWWIVSHDYPPLDGGIATWAYALAQGLFEQGVDVEVVTRHRKDTGSNSAWPVTAIKGFSFKRFGGWWLGRYVMRFAKPGDRVLATTWEVATYLAPRCAAYGLELDVTFHGSDITREPRTWSSFRRVCEHSTRLWTVSHFLKRLLHERGYKSGVLPAPIEALSALSVVHASPRPERWYFVARLTVAKGVDRFLALLSKSDAEGVIIGDGPEREKLQDIAKSLGLSGRVRFLGRIPRNEVMKQLRSADLCFLLPRATDGGGEEGFGLTLLEAASVAVATVGCHTGGVPESIGAGLLLTAPDDAQGSLVEIETWWHPERGNECRLWVAKHHGVQRMLSTLIPDGGQ
jgi:glycosyltransferase involved in cell wall biosynthesis